MKVSIEVKDRREGELIKSAMDDPVARAMVLVIGVLLTLPTHAARMRLLNYVEDHFGEQAEREADAEARELAKSLNGGE